MDISRNWRLRHQRYKLQGTKCECGKIYFPPRKICPKCKSKNLSDFNLKGRGKIYSFTTVYDAPLGFEEYIPYTLALIKLVEGPMILSQLTDVDEDSVKIGMNVEMVIRKVRELGEKGLIVYGYKFGPVLK